MRPRPYRPPPGRPQTSSPGRPLASPPTRLLVCALQRFAVTVSFATDPFRPSTKPIQLLDRLFTNLPAHFGLEEQIGFDEKTDGDVIREELHTLQPIYRLGGLTILSPLIGRLRPVYLDGQIIRRIMNL